MFVSLYRELLSISHVHVSGENRFNSKLLDECRWVVSALLTSQKPKSAKAVFRQHSPARTRHPSSMHLRTIHLCIALLECYCRAFNCRHRERERVKKCDCIPKSCVEFQWNPFSNSKVKLNLNGIRTKMNGYNVNFEVFAFTFPFFSPQRHKRLLGTLSAPSNMIHSDLLLKHTSS